ncbi:MAG TPA: hypothetical protein VMT58_08305 [Candidatus Binataceae bacterium]|nr:hypothetical protein [Candidatus Binataceae bacterium]
MENKLGQPLDYLRDIATASPAAFYEFLMFMPFAGHRKAAPTDGYFLASIGALQHEDCGPCLQIVVDQAIAAGVPESSISAALAGGSTLAPDRKLFLDFGRAVAANAPEAEELRMRLAEQLPAGAMVDLAIVVAASRVFPTLKRGLGRAQSCSIVRVTVAGRDAA